jgi:hypothetical protein
VTTSDWWAVIVVVVLGAALGAAVLPLLTRRDSVPPVPRRALQHVLEQEDSSGRGDGIG